MGSSSAGYLILISCFLLSIVAPDCGFDGQQDILYEGGHDWVNDFNTVLHLVIDLGSNVLFGSR
jgi:hypothetical protein